jgi:hypothetical protein
MTTTTFKRRSINLDDNSHNRGKVLAKKKAVSLSAVLRIIINEAFEEQERIWRKQESSRSCLGV